MQAKRWLLNERQFKSIPIEGNYLDGNLPLNFYAKLNLTGS